MSLSRSLEKVNADQKRMVEFEHALGEWDSPSCTNAFDFYIGVLNEPLIDEVRCEGARENI